MTPEERAHIERALLLDSLRRGEGSRSQQSAFQEWEWRRCASDEEYWFDNYAWLSRKGGGITRFIAWPVQRLALRRGDESSATIKARQIGWTTLDVNRKLHHTIFRDANSAFLLSDTEPKAVEALTKMAVTKDRLPKWMTDRASKRLRETENRKAEKSDAATKVKYGFSEFKVLTSTPNSAAGVSGEVTLDEFGRHRHQRRVLDNVIPSYEGGGTLTVIGNGNGEDELYALWRQADSGEFPGMRAYFLWWGDNPTRLSNALCRVPKKIPRGVSISERIRLRKETEVVSASSLSRDMQMACAHDIALTKESFDSGKGSMYSPWYSETYAKYMRGDLDDIEDAGSADIFAFKRQFPTKVEEAIYLSSGGFFRGSVVNAYSRIAHASGMKPITGHVEHVPEVRKEDGSVVAESWEFRRSASGKSRQYLPPVKGQRYIAGIDPTGDAADGDNSVIKIYRFLDSPDDIAETAARYGHDSPPEVEGIVPWIWEQPSVALELACVYQAKTEPVTLVRFCSSLGYLYNEAFEVVERNNSGGTVISHLKNEYTNLYREVRHDKFADDRGDMLGHWESGASRQVMLDNLQAWVHRGWLFCADLPTISEWGRFGYDEKGRLTHPKGSHDDLLFGDGLAIVGALDLVVNKSDDAEVNFGAEW